MVSELEHPGTDKALVILPGPDMFCLFHGKRYSPGESWHPYLEPQGLMYCLRCTCSEVGSSGHGATCVRYVWEQSPRGREDSLTLEVSSILEPGLLELYSVNDS